jgi:hypothetical protein
MWNERLIGLAQKYDSAVLTVLAADGYALSVRCTAAQFDATNETIHLSGVNARALARPGKACLLFHRHNAVLEDQHELMMKGELVVADGQAIFRPAEFLTGTGSPTTDAMPHSGDPIQLIQFMLLGRRKAREYLAKRGAPWEPIQFDLLIRRMREAGLSK